MFALRSKRVVTPGSVQPTTVVVADGKISTLLPYDIELSVPVVDVGDLVVAPGLVDMHVHINSPGREDWETLQTASAAAVLLCQVAGQLTC